MEVRADMGAIVWHVPVTTGETVAAGDDLVVLESMKMEIPVPAPHAGVVIAVHVVEGQPVAEGDLLVEVDVSLR